MKKTTTILFSILMTSLALGLVSCGTSTPTGTVKNYFKEITSGKFIQDSRTTETSEETKKSFNEASKLLSDAFANLNFTINNKVVDGDIATISTTVSGPNIAVSLNNTYTSCFKSVLLTAFSGQKLSDVDAEIMFNTALIENFNEMISDERTNDITLTKIDNEWTIDASESLKDLILGQPNLTTDQSLK